MDEALTEDQSHYEISLTAGQAFAAFVLMLLSLVRLSQKGKLPQAKSEVVEIAGLYWHFVDIVWIVIFTVVYLIPGVK